MELVALLRVLWRFRPLVLIGLVVAGALGYFVHSKGKYTSVGVASAQVMVDTPQSETLVANPTYSDTLDWRASILADLTGTNDVRARIARELDIRPADLWIHAPYMSVPPVAAQLPAHALDAAATPTQPYELRIQAADLLPIIDIDALAPTAAMATKLITSAEGAIKATSSTDRKQLGRYVVTDVGPVHARTVLNGPRKVIMAVVAMFVFIMWCAGIAVLAGLLDRRRASRRRTQLAQLAAAADGIAAVG